MRTNTTRKFRLVLTALTLAAILAMAGGTVGADQNGHPIASPFGADAMSKAVTKGASLLGVRLTAVGDVVDMDAALVAGADYLKHAQADITENNAGNGDPEVPDDPDDGGWDWVLTSPDFTHSTSASSTNLYGATAQGLYYAYLETNDATYMTAMQDAANYMITDAEIDSAADLVFLMRFQDLSGVTPDSYKAAAKAKFDARITTHGSATAFAVYIRDTRKGQGYENGIIPWDIGAWVVAAQMLEDRYPSDSYDYAQAADDMADVIYQDSFKQNPGYFDLTTDKNKGWDSDYGNKDYWWFSLGVSGLIDAFESADVHTGEIPGLVTLLLACQYDGGAFSYCYGANTDDEDWQSTAYAVMSLARVDQTTYQTKINHAAYWLGATQDAASGGWVYSSGNHYPEVGGECTAALYFGENADEVWVDDNYCDTCANDGHLWGYDAFDNIQDGIDAVEGGTVNVAAGTYTEAILVDKPLTLSGATAGVNKNGYTVPANYAWDDTVESIINHPNPSGGYDTIVDIVDTDDVTLEGFVVQELNAVGNLNSSLVRVYAHTQEISNIVVRNNVIGPNTNTTAQDGAQGRMGLYIVNHPYDDNGVINSTFSGNKIFDCQGNGDNVFLWSSYHAYGAPGPASMSGTVIEDNEIYGSHRSGIETAGGFSGLTIRDNSIYGNGGPGTPDLKYGTGILMIRGSGDKTDCNGYGPVDVTIEDNEIYDNEDHGIYMGPNNQDVTITDNDIHDNGEDAIRVDLIGNYWNPDFDPDPGPYTCLGGSQNVSASSNSIEDNGAGVQVIGTPTNGFVFDAENNWWGAASGPSGEGEGSGDAVSTNVDYSPWLGNYPSTPGSNTYYVDDTSSTAEIQALITGASSGDTIVLTAGTYTPVGGFTINSPGITIMLEDGTVIQASSPCFTVDADDTTITSATTGPGFTGGICEPSDGSHGIQTGQAVSNLVIKDIEIRNGTGTGDGIHIGHDVTNLQIFDTYIHDMGGDGIEYASGVTVSGVHEVQGNLFMNNTGYGVNNETTPTFNVEYNSWGHYDGPGSGDGADGNLDYTPWTHVALSMTSSGSPVADKVGEGYQITYTIKMDAKEVFGADFDLNFSNTNLEVKSIITNTNFQQTDQCKVSTPAEANAGGEISFCGSRTTALNGSAQEVFKVVFEGKVAGTVLLNLDETDDAFAMSPPSGGSNNIYASALTDGSVTVYDATTVTGRIDLQGRANDTGAVMTFGTGSGVGYGPFTFSASTYWGSISASGVVHDTGYPITVSMARYLDVTSASGKTVNITSDNQVLTTLALLGGDADDSNVIDISDVVIIAGQYGNSGADITIPGADINDDDVVDISDLVLVCGNYDKRSETAYGSWTP